MKTTVQLVKPHNPYVGPRSLQRGETIYGREREATKLAALLVAERVVLLHSPSGAGKTSLIQAAVVGQLEKPEEEGGEGFWVLPLMRVNHEPPALDRLPEGFNRYVFSAISSVEAELANGPPRSPEELAGLQLPEYLNHLATRDDRDQVLVFDQFEEILTIDATDWRGHDAFFRQVGAALTNRKQPRWALFSMREEYIGGLDRYLRRIPTHLAITFRLDFLDRTAAQRAVEQPAAKLGVQFSPAAAQELVNDLSMTWTYRQGQGRVKQPGPYVEPVQLQVACHRLWSSLGTKTATIKVIKPKHLAQFKNVDRALADYYADAVRTVASETDVTERALRDWFEYRLISPERLRRQTSTGPEPGGEPAQQALKLLEGEGIYLIRGEQRRETRLYELAHDRLIDPIRDNNADWRTKYLNRFQRLAEQWSKNKSDALLLVGTELNEFQLWMRDHEREATAKERRFLEACNKAKQRQRRRRVITWIIAFVVAIVLALALLAIKSSRDAATQAQLGYSRELVAAALGNLDTDPELSILLALEAVRANPGDEGMRSDERDILYRSVTASRVQARFSTVSTTQPRTAQPGSAGPLGSRTRLADVALQPRGDLVAFASSTGRVELWRKDPPKHLRDFIPPGAAAQGSPPAVVRVAFSPDGRRLAAADQGGTATVWEVASGRRVLTLRQPTPLTSITFSRDGELLVTGAIDRSAVVWNARSGRLLAALKHPEPVAAVAFGPGGQLATASGGTVRLWQAKSGRPTDRHYSAPSAVSSVAFSPDGRWLAAGSLDGTATLWDIAGGSQLPALSGHTNAVLWVGFAPDGARVATTSSDGTAKVWDARSGRELLTLLGHRGPVSGAAFTADSTGMVTASWDGTGRRWLVASGHAGFINSVSFDPPQQRLATASTDRTVRIWDVATRRELMTLTGHLGEVNQVVFNRNGSRLASASADGTARIWDPGTGRPLRVLDAGTPLNAVAFRPDGSRLALAGGDGNVSVWDVESGKRLLSFQAHAGPVNDLSWSPNGKRIATGGDDGLANVWEAATGIQLLHLSGHTERVLAVAFDPNGALLASGSLDQTAVVWDARSGRARHTFRGHAGSVSDVAFSPDGRQLATASWDKSAKTWDVRSGRDQLVLRNSAEVNAVAFSPNGRFLVTASSDKNFQLYPLLEDDLLEAAHARLTRELSPEECRQYLRDSC